MATFAEQMVEKLQAILLANAGLASVSVDGTMVAYKDLAHGGDLPERRTSGLLGPVKLQVWC